MGLSDIVKTERNFLDQTVADGPLLSWIQNPELRTQNSEPRTEHPELRTQLLLDFFHINDRINKYCDGFKNNDQEICISGYDMVVVAHLTPGVGRRDPIRLIMQ